jgi:hypothetical protein
MWIDPFAILSSLFTCLPFFASLYRIEENIKKPNRYLFLYFTICVLTEIVCFILKNRNNNNGLFLNIFSLLEAFCFFCYYQELLRHKALAVRMLFALYVLSVCTVFLFFDVPVAFNLKARFLTLLFLLILSIIYVFTLIQKEQPAYLTQYRGFWTSVAIQVYSMGNLLYFLSFNILLGMQTRHLIHIALNITYNLLLAWPILRRNVISG